MAEDKNLLNWTLFLGKYSLDLPSLIIEQLNVGSKEDAKRLLKNFSAEEQGLASERAAFCGYLKAVKFFVENGVNIEASLDLVRHRLTPLKSSYDQGHLLIVKYLIEKGCDINGIGSQKPDDTPLIMAAKKGHIEIVKYLPDHNADVTLKNSSDKNALDVAKTDEIRSLLEKALIQQLQNPKEQEIK